MFGSFYFGQPYFAQPEVFAPAPAPLPTEPGASGDKKLLEQILKNQRRRPAQKTPRKSQITVVKIFKPEPVIGAGSLIQQPATMVGEGSVGISSDGKLRTKRANISGRAQIGMVVRGILAALPTKTMAARGATILDAQGNIEFQLKRTQFQRNLIKAIHQEEEMLAILLMSNS